MSIKADRWIRQQALERGMIEPFVEGQVRSGVVSFGLSSYGYDIRIADEFKIFTNVNSTIIDPKQFDPRSFVDLKSDVCIIPPNSFVLGRTVEYFRIPRNVLCVCVGKSTYARCFRGDTKVALADGTAPTLEEMARRHEQGEMFWGYSVGQHGRIIVTLLDAPRYIGTDALLNLTLDNGATIATTPDHQFMTRDGRMVQAHELRPNDSLMPLYREGSFHALKIYQPLDGYRDLLTKLVSTAGVCRLAGQPKEELASVFRRMPASHQGTRLNHTIVSIDELPGMHDVYCLTVPEAGNFALDAGVFVGNCGLIVNVTPFEPGWEGYVTLEVSNTTPLPAKIYANEGIAQVLFFEGDEAPLVAYNDRNGKYQGQEGVTLPRI